MDWVAEHVQSVSSAAFSIKWPFPLELPIGPRHGLVGKQKVEDMRTKLHAFVVENDLRPIWFFEILFHSWAGLQVPAAHFRVPLARHGFDIAMYLTFLVIWTFAVVLDYGNAAELTTSQLASSKEMCGTLQCGTVFYMRLWCWLYIVGSLEKELRQLVRLREVYFTDIWNWIEVLSPGTALGGLILLELGHPNNAARLLAISVALLWSRLLQTLRGLQSIGPLIPVIFKMVGQVLRLGSVMLILLVAFSFALYGILRPDIGVHATYAGKTALNDEMLAAQRDAPWPEDYHDMPSTFKTLFRAALGDISMDFTGTKFGNTALGLLVVYIILMVVLFFNLLITLLMKKYEDVAEELAKEFAYVRATHVFWQQDAMLDYELPPPFNLVQKIHPKRDLVAWVVWLTIMPPFFGSVLFVLLAVVTFVYCPLLFAAFVHAKLVELWWRVKAEGPAKKTGPQFQMDEDLQILLSLAKQKKESETQAKEGQAGAEGQAADDQAATGANPQPQYLAPKQKKILQAFQGVVQGAKKHSRLQLPLGVWASLFFGVLHWAGILSCSLVSFVLYYFHTIWKLGTRLASTCSTKLEKARHDKQEEEAGENIRLLAVHLARCIDLTSEMNGDEARGDWSNSQRRGVLDQLVQDEFKTKAEREDEEREQAERSVHFPLRDLPKLICCLTHLLFCVTQNRPPRS